MCCSSSRAGHGCEYSHSGGAKLEAPAALPKKKKLRHAGQHPAATGSVTFDRGTVADTAGLPRGAHKVLAIAAEDLPPRAARAFLRCRVTLCLEEATGAVRGVDAEGADPGVSDKDLYARQFEQPRYPPTPWRNSCWA